MLDSLRMLEPVDVVMLAVCGGMVALLAWLLWALWSNSQRPTFELVKAEWTCTRSETRTHLQPMLVGKVWTTLPVSTSQCLQYSRTGAQ